jgi:hypothetical protein
MALLPRLPHLSTKLTRVLGTSHAFAAAAVPTHGSSCKVVLTPLASLSFTLSQAWCLWPSHRCSRRSEWPTSSALRE